MNAIHLSDYFTVGFVLVEAVLVLVAIVFTWLILPAFLERDRGTGRPSWRDLLRTPAVVLRALLSA